MARFSPPADWQGRAEEATERLRGMSTEQRRAYLKTAAAARLWGELRADLLKLSFDKCWYTEAPIGAGDAQVEHFRPKLGYSVIGSQQHDGYWWLSFDASNYRLAASVPNRSKTSDFPIHGPRACGETDCLDDECPILLDPAQLADTLLITYVEGGQAAVSPDASPADIERARYSIERFALNSATIMRSRQMVWANCHATIQRWEIARWRSATSPAFRARVEEHTRRLKEMTDQSKSFSTVAMACLEAHGAARSVIGR